MNPSETAESAKALVFQSGSLNAGHLQIVAGIFLFIIY